MKHLLLVTVGAILCLSGCGAADYDDDDVQLEADWAAEDAAAEAEQAEYMAWATSDDRSLNLACNMPDYRRGQSEVYIGLHSPLYPSVKTKTDFLVAKLKELAPKVTDEDVYDVEAYNDVKNHMAMLGQWSFMMGIDAAMKQQILVCDHQQYDDNKCTLMAEMMGSDFTLQDIEKQGDILRYSFLHTAENMIVTSELKGSDLDGVKINGLKGGIPFLQGEWLRGEDGTERTNASTSQDETYTYTENPDCSGTASWHRVDDDRPRKLGFTWTSAKTDGFTLTYRDCHENDLGEVSCKNGSF